MPMYHRNTTHAQLHPFHKQRNGTWHLLSNIFPLRNILNFPVIVPRVRNY